MTHHFASGWPDGWERTPPHLRTAGRFSTDGHRISISGGFERVNVALRRIGATEHSLHCS